LHAQLLDQRVRELGRAPAATTPEWLERYNRSLLEARSDVERLGAVVAKCPDIAAATAPLQAVIDRIRNDVLTRELLRLIAQDEEITLRWIHDAYARRAER